MTALQQNCYFAHPKIAFGNAGDQDKTVKARAVNSIQKIRNVEKGNQEREPDRVRDFHLPRCNFAATSYTDLIILK